MKREKVEHRVGDIVAVEFIANKIEGRKPICLIDGCVGFINRTYKGQFIDEHSVWHVEVCQINENSMVVDPVQEIKTAFENIREIKQRMKLLTPVAKAKHVKPKVFYPYKSKQERVGK
jgi:hypothetical protein